MEVWYHKWNSIECEEDEDISEYITRFKKVYKRVDLIKQIPTKIIIQKYINSLSPKFVEFLTIIELSILKETIESTLNIKTSQKVIVKKRKIKPI